MLCLDPSSLDIDAVLAEFRENGFARLGRVASDEALAAMRARTEELMLGRIAYPGLFFQRDTESGAYEDLTYGRGWEGPSLNYRKIEKVEVDPVFSAWIDNPLFERIARAKIPGDIVIYRAVIMGKKAQGGTVLPWHQDGGKFWGLDRAPELQIWTALDDAPEEAGCVELIPRSHLRGLATAIGGVVPKNILEASGLEDQRVALPARAGEALLIHNFVWHRSGVNRTGAPRRALSICYMSAETRCTRTRRKPRQFHRVFSTTPSEKNV